MTSKVPVLSSDALINMPELREKECIMQKYRSLSHQSKSKMPTGAVTSVFLESKKGLAKI